jgi:flagellar capping protein FliD
MEIMKMRFGVIIVFVAAVALPILFGAVPAMQTKAQEAQNANNWNNGNDWRNGDDINRASPVRPLDPIPSLQPINTLPGGNPGNLGQANSSIIQIQQQIQSQMASCVQKKQQVYNQLVAQNRQVDQLEAQYDSVGTAIGNAKTDQQTTALQAQQDRIQQNIDRLNDTIANTQDALDQQISDCQDRISDLQSRQDDLQTQLNDQFDTLLDYQLPD